MGRLIDADKLYDDLADKLKWLMGYGDDVYLSVGDDIRCAVANQPTAYDPDKVVQQLEDLKNQVPVNRILDDIINDKPKELGQLIAYDEAIEAVKGGGVNGN